MKKLILISAVAATTLFAEGLSDVAKKVAVDHAKSEATKTVNSQIDKAVGTTEKKSDDAKAEKKEEAKEEKTDATSSLKDQAIDVAAGQVKEHTGVDKGLAKEAIKSVVK
jgi:outer membrane murein-binding lipoprotein Lpp